MCSRVVCQEFAELKQLQLRVLRTLRDIWNRPNYVSLNSEG